MKLAAISMLLLLSFNFMGYQLWFYILQKSADNALATQLNAQAYNDEDLIAIKVPLRLPYQTAQTDFERIDGEVKIDGQIYKYVKRKVERGQLVLLCLPNEKKMQLQQAHQRAYHLTNDVPATGKTNGTKSILLKNVFSDYDSTTALWQLTPITTAICYPQVVEENLYFSFYTAPEHPPQATTA